MGYPVSSRPRVASWCPFLRLEEELTQQGVNCAQDSPPSASGGRPQTSALHSCGRTASRSWGSPVPGGWPWVCPACLRLSGRMLMFAQHKTQKTYTPPCGLAAPHLGRAPGGSCPRVLFVARPVTCFGGLSYCLI